MSPIQASYLQIFSFSDLKPLLDKQLCTLFLETHPFLLGGFFAFTFTYCTVLLIEKACVSEHSVHKYLQSTKSNLKAVHPHEINY